LPITNDQSIDSQHRVTDSNKKVAKTGVGFCTIASPAAIDQGRYASVAGQIPKPPPKTSDKAQCGPYFQEYRQVI